METLIFLGKFIVATASLLLLYWMVLRHRASYRLARLYLVGLPILGLLMATLSFDTEIESPIDLQRPTERIEMALTHTAEVTAPQPASRNVVMANEPADESPSAETVMTQPLPEIALAETRTTEEETAAPLTWEQWAGILIGGTSCVLILIFFYYVWRIVHIKRQLLTTKTSEGYDLIHSQSVETPFSFGKTIFLPATLDSQSEEMIVRHEKAHIAHHHYLEVWYIELLVRLCWFNPVMWLCRSELSNIHEYEADHDVIRHGTNIHAYQSTLLEMVMNENCPAVNGFSHSFIRQRFIEMKNSTAGSLGKVGKISLMAAVAVLFASFTLRTVPSATEQKWGNPIWPEPMLFVFEGTLEKEFTETQLNLYLADETFHIEEETPFAVIPIVDHKFHYEIPLDRVTGGRLRGIGQDGQKTDVCLEQFFVPGMYRKVKVEKHENGLYSHWSSSHSGSTYVKAVKRAITAVQKKTGLRSPHYPKIGGKSWNKIDTEKLKGLDYYFTELESVFFEDDRTVLHLTPNQISLFIESQFIFSEYLDFLEDANGNRYKFLGQFPERKENKLEAAVYGYYYFFEKMPQDTKSFDIGNRRTEENVDSLYDKMKDQNRKVKKEDGGVVYYNIENVTPRKETKDTSQKPNFHITITATPGIPDCGYIIELGNNRSFPWESELVADLPVDEKRQCSFSTHLDDICTGEVTAIFPDGSVCFMPVRLPFVPGEDVDLYIYHANHQVVGHKTDFYKEWSDAKLFTENINRRADLTRMDKNNREIEYLNKNNDKLGSLYYFSLHESADVAYGLDSLPPAILDTKFGKDWVKGASRRAEYKAKKLRTQNNPLLIFPDPEQAGSYTIKDELDKLDSLILEGGGYVLEKEYKGTDSSKPFSYHENAQNGVKVYKTILEKKDSIQKVYYRTR